MTSLRRDDRAQHVDTVDAVTAVADASANPDRLRELCLDAARKTGDMLVELRRSNSVGVTATKTSGTDIVTNADNAAEQLLREELLGARPNDAWLGEESGESTGDGDTQVRWIADPIDGTVNYLYSLPGWAVSVAAEVSGNIVAGAVVVPTFDEEFSAAIGQGATCNGLELAVSSCDRLDSALIATGFAYRSDVRARQVAVVARLLPLVRDIRRVGAASVDFCSVAAGRVDGYFETGLQPWDRAAGALIAREAGATVFESPDGDVIASAPQLIDVLTNTLGHLRSVEGT